MGTCILVCLLVELSKIHVVKSDDLASVWAIVFVEEKKNQSDLRFFLKIEDEFVGSEVCQLVLHAEGRHVADKRENGSDAEPS